MPRSAASGSQPHRSGSFSIGLKCQVHAILAEHGVQLPELTDLFGKRGRQFLERLSLPELSRCCVEADLRLIDGLGVEIRALERELATLLRNDDRIRRLRAIPGIGFFTAAAVVAEIWDVSRFLTPDRLCSWAGLTPSERSSAGHTRRGHITKAGSTLVRWAMVEAAARGTRHVDHRRFFVRVMHEDLSRRQIARVALARRLLTLCYYALRDEGGCRAYPVAA